MAAEPFGQRQRLFQIDFALCVEAGSEAETFTRDIDRKTVGGLFDHGHAGAIEGNRVTQIDIMQRQAAGIDD